MQEYNCIYYVLIKLRTKPYPMTLLAGLCTPNLVGLARLDCQRAMEVYDFITYYRIAGNVCEELKFCGLQVWQEFTNITSAKLLCSVNRKLYFLLQIAKCNYRKHFRLYCTLTLDCKQSMILSCPYTLEGFPRQV